MSNNTPLIVNCPTCADPVTWEEKNKERPFCSERCKLIDLGAWASEEYSIASQSQDEWEIAEAQSASNTSESLQ
ncbi:hypothetical protein A3715_09255 [Oleiphilus sp. HI0009]|uniref:DNA gyrase inhibitor YacG n=1 Tax=unclassified Oleiphilus TaxID=2631174 RepID=UPI0007C2A1A3